MFVTIEDIVVGLRSPHALNTIVALPAMLRRFTYRSVCLKGVVIDGFMARSCGEVGSAGGRVIVKDDSSLRTCRLASRYLPTYTSRSRYFLRRSSVTSKTRSNN